MVDSAQFFKICEVNELALGQTHSFQLELGELEVAGFVLNWQGQFYAYQNRCPHLGVNMDWAPNQFFDAEHRFIQCTMHGALFEPNNGFCIRGPCLGLSLTALGIVILDQIIYLDLDNVFIDP